MLVAVLAYGPGNQLDINRRPTLEQVRQLPLDSTAARAVFDYVEAYGRLNSIYELLRVPGITPAKLEELKPLIRVTPTDWEDIRTNNVQRVQKRLATEEGPTAAAVAVWEDRLIAPVDVNSATIDELLVLDNVSLVDAVSVVRYARGGGRLSSRRDLAGRVDGLSTYGYRGMRDYVTFRSPESARADEWRLGGNYRAKYQTGPDWDVEASPDEFDAALRNLTADSAEFRQAGYTAAEVEFLRQRLEKEREFRVNMRNRAQFEHRVRARLGGAARAGAWLAQKLYEPLTLDDAKGHVAAQNLGPLRRLMVGDYRLVLGQGILMDNTAELVRRTHERAQGLFSDLSENPGFGLRGVAADLDWWRLGALGFFSHSARDAILNPDSSANYYVVATPRYPTMKNVLRQTDAGGNFRFDLSDLGVVPTGTRLGVSAITARTSRPLRPDPKFLDLPGDAEVLDDPNYTRLDTGSNRLFYGADFRTVVQNVSLEAEAARQRGGGLAYVAKARTQYDYLYVTALYRHYDVDYNNPYNRGYCEQLRFEDTPLEKPYRLTDPAFAALQEFPMPKAEQGFLIDTRYQISRQITFTRVYLDAWRNLAWGADNLRFQGEVEYRPIFPLRLRFKEKLQAKENPKIAGATRSFTLESSVKAMLSLTNWDFLTAELRYGRVLLTPTLKYGDESSMSGDFLAVQWDHNFSDDLSSDIGVAAWNSRGMSEWTFEDRGIDFLEGQGFRWYVAFTDRLSDNLLVYVKARHKVSDFPHTGLSGTERIHYPGSSEPVRDFVTRDSRFDVSLQLDLLW